MKKLQKQRFDKILELLKISDYLKYSDLEKQMNVSAITIRRDVIKMETLGLLNRISGGIENKSISQDIDYNLRSKKNLSAKKAVAKKASKYIKNNLIIFLDAGTTIFELIPYLKGKNITAITNCIEHINKLIKNEINFILLGGYVKPSTKATVGIETLNQLDKFNFDIAFIGANGVDKEKGITTPDIEEAHIKTKAIKHSKKVYILTDSSKFNKISNVKFSEYDNVNIITEKGEIN
ncbi:DeoR/GlpR family DNA-binding transcription regulator [Oceanivirga salmonicida]|uniref:DeoR/GlpR family DNA-binding transcription regulator n=2 Tax=Oceanivirga salmonicida TaxID=1769291 RepID=UPI00083300B2|nr:DeoR/GlpR family DNA-binding transcription regulator [Oceanivirga salmonicida]